MASIRNPFKLRATEQINNPSQFLHLFDPNVLNIITSDWFIEKVHFINSSPGAGKSSLLRIFSPDILLELHNTGRANPEYKEIFSKLNKLDIISNNGPELLGIGISCSGNLKSIKDCAFKPQLEEKILFTLLTSRLILSMLHGVMILKNLSSTEELRKLKIKNPNSKIFSSEKIPDNGCDLFLWANNIEKNACEIIDSLDSISDISIKIPDISNAIFLLKAENLLYDGDPLAKKTLIMFDDFHELPLEQRTLIKKFLYSVKFPISFWIAQRFEGINPKEFLSTNISAGAMEGREYDNVFLESEWKKQYKGYNVGAYENVLNNIANKRVNISNYKEIPSFRDCLKDSLNDKKWENKYEKIVSEISQKITKKVGSSKKYTQWITEIEKINNSKESFPQKAIEWRSLEILISRAEKKGQLTLENEFIEEQQPQVKKDVEILKGYAQLFLSKEYDLPYYFGFSKLSEISFSNFEQFLAFSADLFEEAISSHTIKKNSYLLSPSRQEQIIKNVAERKWQEIPKRIPHGEAIQIFLEKFCQFAVFETYNSSASYPPGITGFSIIDEEYEILIKSITDEKKIGYSNLGYLIYICLSNNLLRMTPNITQGSKFGHKFYLNRWICVKFGLPLGYGGWRWKRIEELSRWVPEKPLIGTGRQIYAEF